MPESKSLAAVTSVAMTNFKLKRNTQKEKTPQKVEEKARKSIKIVE